VRALNTSIAVAMGLTMVLGSLPRGAAAAEEVADDVTRAVQAEEPKTVAWYRDIHAHPELQNQEFRTAALVADHLRRLKFDSVRTGVAHTGVVGVLRGSRPGGVVALRADMDALPVLEQTGLPYASKARGVYDGHDVPVMHACGHDAHVAMLMSAAEVLAGMRHDFAGTVVFLFQPSEEERPKDDQSVGAELMIAEGALDNPKPEAVYGIHVLPLPPGQIGYASGVTMAAQETFEVKLIGRQAHGSTPWMGIDLVPLAGEIVSALGRIPSNQVDMTRGPTVLTIGRIQGGQIANVIPAEIEFAGTMRAVVDNNRKLAMAAIERIATNTAAAGGARADVHFKRGYPITYNDPALTEKILPVLRRVAGEHGVVAMQPLLAAEDFSYYQQRVPGVFYYLGVNQDNARPEEIYANHSDKFHVNESTLKYGVEAHVRVALRQLETHRVGD
jgi:amidohydrolase